MNSQKPEDDVTVPESGSKAEQEVKSASETEETVKNNSGAEESVKNDSGAEETTEKPKKENMFKSRFNSSKEKLKAGLDGTTKAARERIKTIVDSSKDTVKGDVGKISEKVNDQMKGLNSFWNEFSVEVSPVSLINR